MIEVSRFILKGIVKSKYIFIAFLTMIVLVLSLMILNQQQPSSKLKEFEATFSNDENNLSNVISQYYAKDAGMGLSEEEAESLGHLITHERYLKELLQEIRLGSLDFVPTHKKYIETYEAVNLDVTVDVHTSNNFFKPLDKIELLETHQLPYLEEETPWNTALFTKQLFQVFFNPATAFIFLLLFIYHYISSRENRTFDFFKLNSLLPTSIYYGYLMPFFILAIGYVLLVALLSILPVLLTGNLSTIHYPVDVNLIGESKLISVWKWLIYLPISWGIFVSLFLVILIVPLRMRLSMGMTLSIFALFSLCWYFLFTQFGFLLFNPLHLLFYYEEYVLTSPFFMRYLLVMSCLFLISMVALYFVINKNYSRRIVRLSSKERGKQSFPKKRWKILQFEHIKAKRKNKVLVTITCLFLLIGGTFIYVNHQYAALPKKYANVIEGLINVRAVGLSNNELNLFAMTTEKEILQDKVTEGLEEEIEAVSKTIKFVQKDINRLEKFYDEIGEEGFAERFRQEVFSEELAEVREFAATLDNQAGLEMLATVEQNRILEEQKITPWQMNYMLNVNYSLPELFKADEVHYDIAKENYERNIKYDNSALFFLYKYVDWNVMWGALAVFVLFLWTSLSDEYRPTRTKNFLLTKPISFKSVYVNKWIYNLLLTYTLLFGVLGVVFVVSLFVNGLGELHYPMLVYSLENVEDTFLFSLEENVYFSFENLSTLLLKSGLLMIGQLFFLNGLFSLLGRWFTNHYATVITMFMVMLAGYSFANKYIEVSWSYINPFLYFDTWQVVNGWRSIEANALQVNDVYGVVVLFSSGLLLFILGLVGRRRG